MLTNLIVVLQIFLFLFKVDPFKFYHHGFGKTQTYCVFTTHVWFLANTLTCLRYLVKNTHVW